MPIRAQASSPACATLDAAQTTEALTVRRSRDVGGVGFQESVIREVLEAVWKSEAWGRKDKGQKKQTRPSRKLGIGS
jgi:hypothetical protein